MTFRPRTFWYYMRSFFRRTWTLDDYPIDVTFHPNGTAAPDESGSWVPPYTAGTPGMFLVGLGVTADAARADLREKFEKRRKEKPLPRPGTSEPIEIAASDRIEAFGALLDEFIERVLQSEWVFLSDESTLYDFPDPDVKRRIMLLYGIDPDRLPDQRIVTVLDAIAAR
ncbi:MAG TPA: hypothetical protein VK669_09850 [Candidatus Limnocylindrales bacterium]|nr:hypothetical protein [Candidatus Limnocylindrales bacterium]